MQAINQINEGEIAMVTRQTSKGELNHFKIKMVTRNCFEITILSGDFKIIDDVRFYTMSGVISLLLGGMFRDPKGKGFSPVVEMDKVNGEKVKLDKTFLCLN